MFQRHLAVFAIFALLSAAVCAQNTDRFASLDTNGDGKITQDEFPGGPGLFAQLDKNKDGFIDKDEAKALAAKKESKRAAKDRGPLPEDIETQSDIVYKAVGGQKLALDLYRVKGKTYEKAPLIIFIHGGGYVGGNKQGAVKRAPDLFLPLMREHGYLVASLDYRLCAAKGPKLVDCSTDCKDAVRFLVKNSAAYGIDPARIATMGTSAGGSLAMIQPLTQDADLPGDPDLAKVPVAVKCAVSWFGCTDFTKMEGFREQKVQDRGPVLFKGSAEADKHEREIVSPVYYMLQAKGKTPVLLVHGDSDQTVPQPQSIWMNDEAKRIGFPIEFVNVKNAGHGFQDTGKGPISPSMQDIYKLTLDFILKNNK